jgi:hypothetical protein
MSGRDAMTCAEVRERLPLVPGADLLPAEDVQVREHLRDCASCRKELGSFVRVRKVLGGFGAAFEAGQSAGDKEFFSRLRTDTITAVRRDTDRRRRQRAKSPRRSVAGIMTAAALFLLGVYLVPLLLPELTPIPTNLPRIEADWPVGVIHDPRFRNVGLYGLMGHQRLFPDQRVPLGEERPLGGKLLEALELAPERDVKVLRNVRGAVSRPGRRK